MLAEILLFYGNVHLTLDYGSLRSILELIGPHNLNSLIENGFVSITYFNNQNSVISKKQPFLTYYDFGFVGLAGTRSREFKTMDEQIFHAYRQHSRPIPGYRALAKRFIDHAELMSFSDFKVNGIKLSHDFSNLVEDRDYVNNQMNFILSQIVPGFSIPNNYHFFT